MSKKEEIIEMLKDGASYNVIEQSTGAERAYIRQIASDHRRKDIKEDKVSSEGKEPEKEDSDEGKKMNEGKGEFLEFEMWRKDRKDSENWDESKGKSGLEYHKDWVAEKKYECGCGCTLNKKGDFCPHCGTSLDWEGVE